MGIGQPAMVDRTIVPRTGGLAAKAPINKAAGRDRVAGAPDGPSAERPAQQH